MRFRAAWDLSFPPRWRAQEHRHPEHWEVIMVTEGLFEMHFGGKSHQAIPGSVIIHPAQETHWEMTTSTSSARMMGLSWKQEDSAQARALVRLSHDVTGRVGYALHWINSLQNSFGYNLSIFDGLVDALLFECQERPNTLGDDRMARVRSYIAQSTHSALSLGKLAQVAHLSERHFAREFEQRTGVTPMSYVRRIRLEKAEASIIQSDKPFRAIALECGFRDEFEFSRVFRRERGFPPSALR